MNSANKFLMLLNVLFFVAIIGIVIYFQAASFEAKQGKQIDSILSN